MSIFIHNGTHAMLVKNIHTTYKYMTENRNELTCWNLENHTVL